MEKEKKHTGIKILIFFVLFIAVILLYGFYINPYQLKVKEIPIYNKDLPKSYNGLKIVQFSDLHYNRTVKEKELKKITKEINKLNPDIIVFTGDLFDTKPSEDDIKTLIKYLTSLECKLKKFAVIGDYDNKYLDTYEEILNEANFNILDNINYLLYYKNEEPINILGFTNKVDNSLYSEDYLNITLIHKPDMVSKINNSSIVLAGHSLGGIIKLPFIDGLIKKDGAKNYLNDYYKVDNNDLYISNGLGTEKISFRLFNTPSITLYRVYNS